SRSRNRRRWWCRRRACRDACERRCRRESPDYWPRPSPARHFRRAAPRRWQRSCRQGCRCPRRRCPWRSPPCRFELPCQNAFAGLDLSGGFGNGTTVTRKDFAAVNFQSFFFIAAHQVDVELRYTGFPQRFELLAMLLDRADQAEAVDDFVAHKIGVVAAHLAV